MEIIIIVTFVSHSSGNVMVTMICTTGTLGAPMVGQNVPKEMTKISPEMIFALPTHLNRNQRQVQTDDVACLKSSIQKFLN